MLKNAIALSSNVIIRKIAPNTIKIADDLVEDIKQFQHNCPLIAVFSNPGLKARHLEQISKKIGHTG